MSESTVKPSGQPVPATPHHEPPKATPASAFSPTAVGAYEKPVIRKYDQIDQVRPYGPSEI